MRIAILSRGPNLYSTRRLAEAAAQRGHEVQVINPLRCYMNINPVHPEIHYRGATLPPFDAVIPRIGASVTFYGSAVVRQFEMMGVFTLNESVAISRSPRQVAFTATAFAQGYRAARDRFRAFPGRYPRPDQTGRRRAHGH